MDHTIHVIARIRSDFHTKFGIPRQSGLVESLQAEVIFEPAYRSAEAVRGLEDFSHIWLLWQFSRAVRDGWSPTVRPPRLGGNRRLGVFASRSPFRPNPIGLSAVRLVGVELGGGDGPLLHVAGADLMDGTPIYDIKPYLPYADSRPNASCGFADCEDQDSLTVSIPSSCAENISGKRLSALTQLLAQDPRPAYQTDASRIYGLSYAGYEVKFRVEENTLYVMSIEQQLN